MSFHRLASGAHRHRGLAAAAIVSLCLAGPAGASDYLHTCRSADGLVVLDDGTLVLGENAQPGKAGKATAHTVLGELVLAEEKGTCTPSSPDARGKSFTYETRVYVQRIAFELDGNKVETTVLCELAADGLPAAFNCDKQTVTSKTQLPMSKPAARAR